MCPNKGKSGQQSIDEVHTGGTKPGLGYVNPAKPADNKQQESVKKSNFIQGSQRQDESNAGGPKVGLGTEQGY